MATRFRMSLCLAFLAFFSMHMRTIDGCSPPLPGEEIPETLEYKMVLSDAVVQGYTRQRHRDTNYPDDDVYIVDFEIRCIFKGSPLPEMIRIYDVGTIAGLCLSTEMPKNKSLLIYLRRSDGGNFVPSYHEDPGSPQYLEEVVGLCETEIAYPEGYSETRNKEECPEPYQYDDCVPVPTFKTSQAETSTNPMGEKEIVKMEDEDKVNDMSNNMNKEGDHVVNKNKGKGTGKNNNEKEAAYEPVKTNSGGSNGGDIDTGDSNDNTESEEGEGFDPDGSTATLTFNIFVPLAMVTVWFVLT